MAEEKRPGPGAVDSDADFDPAVEWFRKREAMSRAQVDALTLEKRRQVFFVTGLSDLEAIKAVQDSLARSLGQGETFEEWKEKVKTQGLFNSPEFTEHRLETIFRTNLQNAFATGRYMEMTSPAVLRRRPYWRFSAVKDSRTTKVCQACAGTILPADHPWWKSHVPPLHFNCRSTFVPMTEKDALVAGITANPPEVRAALGFGSPPFGVPAAARDMPTEAQREAAEKTSVEVQTAVEERNNASAEVTEAKREKTATAQAKKAAEKAVLEADPEDLPARQAELVRANEADKKAGENLAKKEKSLEKAEKRADAAEEKHEEEPRNWLQVPARLVRLAVGVAAPAVSLWRKLSELFVAGFDFMALGRGGKVRELKAVPKGTHSTSPRPKKRLDETKWAHIPKNIRENVEAIANEKGGPNLLAEPETIKDALKRVNPHYSSGLRQYRYNCQRCVAAFEARMRGLDVEANPILSLEDPVATWPKITEVYTNGMGNAKWFQNIASNEELEKSFWGVINSAPKGSRFTIVLKTKQKYSHALNAYKDETGRLFFVDTQCPTMERQKQVLKALNNIDLKKGFGIIRTDNLEFSDEASKFFHPSGSGKEKTK